MTTNAEGVAALRDLANPNVSATQLIQQFDVKPLLELAGRQDDSSFNRAFLTQAERRKRIDALREKNTKLNTSLFKLMNFGAFNKQPLAQIETLQSLKSFFQDTSEKQKQYEDIADQFARQKLKAFSNPPQVQTIQTDKGVGIDVLAPIGTKVR